MPPPFSFLTAFDRNIGWLTEWEQLALKGKKVAIAGMGGVGGFHLLTLTRLGVGAFNIADLDHFELANFNRQVGASLASIGRPKVDVLAEMALAINPELAITRFQNGVQTEDIDAFLAGVDLFIDGFDFFVLDIRRKVFRRCAELGIPALTAAPVGMGVGLVGFTPEGMDFEDYFRFEGKSELRQYVNFLLGMAPSGIHRSYLVDPGRLDFARKKAPSTIIGVQLAASVTAAAALKLLLGRGGFRPAPYHHHYDAFLGRLVETRLRWGNAGPLQSMKANAAERVFQSLSRAPPRPQARHPVGWLEQTIDIARWTPSGDNSQPWRFGHAEDGGLMMFVKDTSAGNIYEYNDGQPTLLSAGMMLGSLQIAASNFSKTLTWEYKGKIGDQHRIDLQFTGDDAVSRDLLSGQIPLRSVDRRPYRLRRLTAAEKNELASTLGDGLEIAWFEKPSERMAISALNAAATDIRLRIPETFDIHKQVIDWHRKQSPSGIPAGALGLDRATLSIMRWAMHSQVRMRRLNAVFGTGLARLQMDFLPGILCAAHFTIQATAPAQEGRNRILQLLRSGASLQRFWLTATRLGLAVQPSLAPLAFLHHAGADQPFTRDAGMQGASGKLAHRARHILPAGGGAPLFMGRIGEPGANRLTRSTRLTFDELMLDRAAVDAATRA